MSVKDPTYDPVNLISRYLAGEATDEETSHLRKWMAEDPQHRELFEQYRKLWEKTGDVSFYRQLDTHTEWEKLERRLGALETPSSVISSRGNLRSIVFRVAAVLVIALLTVFAVRYIRGMYGMVRYTADTDVKEYHLPDGSTVTLNAGSILSYSKKFNKNHRSVTLEGEAYFDVIHHADIPFTVEAENIRVTVLGTAFTVDATDPEEEIHVVVDRGKVSMRDTRDKDNVILTPGEEGRWIASTGMLYEQPVSDPNYLAWKTGRIIFSDIPLSRGLKVLQDVYHTEFKLTDPGTGDCRLTATFDNEPLDSVLEVLSAILEVHITEKNGTYIVSGTGCGKQDPS